MTLRIFDRLLTKLLGSRHKGGSPQPSAEPVDIAPILDDLAAKAGQKLDWRHSVVDLMKALDMDSSLDARTELASELSYPGDPANVSAMNVWLHTEIMRRVRDNGGKVPDELL